MSETGEVLSQRLREIRERLGKTTEGPWRHDWNPRAFRDEVRAPSCIPDEPEMTQLVARVGYQRKDDAIFIVHAPDDIRWLLAQVEAPSIAPTPTDTEAP